MSKTTENIIVVIIMVAIVIGLMYFVGYDNIKDWLSTPFVWKENEDISIRLLWKETNRVTNEEELAFVIENATPEQLTEYNFIVTLEGVEMCLPGTSFHNSAIEPFDLRVLEYSISGRPGNFDGFTQENIEKIRNCDIEDLQFSYKTEYIKTDEKNLINNNGTVKIITILVLSLGLGLLGFVERFPVWVRIILKVCSLPFIICLIFMYLFATRSEREEKAKNTGTKKYIG